MSSETTNWLNNNVLVGYTEKRGTAWHMRQSEQGAEPNHYVGPVPLEDVHRRLFHWSPISAPVWVEVGGKKYLDPTRVAQVRSDTLDVMGIFSPKYVGHDYQQWLVTEVATILDTSSGDLQIGSAGLLRKGAVGWVQFEMEDTVETAGVQYRPFLTAATSFDGSLATSYTMGAQVVVCDNTLAGALGDRSQQVKRRHSVHSLTNIGDVRDALGLVIATTEGLMEEIYALANETVTDKVWRAFLDSVALVDPKAGKRSQTMATGKREALEALWATDERVAPWAGSAYGVLAAMNTYQQHIQPVRNISRPERNALNMVDGAAAKADWATLATLRQVQNA